jgi:hypothetical protein
VILHRGEDKASSQTTLGAAWTLRRASLKRLLQKEKTAKVREGSAVFSGRPDGKNLFSQSGECYRELIGQKLAGEKMIIANLEGQFFWNTMKHAVFGCYIRTHIFVYS